MARNKNKASNIDESVRREHKYCSVCGSEMTATKTFLPSTYDTKSGQEVKGDEVYKWRCSVSRDHDEFVFVV